MIKRQGPLEIITRRPAGARRETPVLFVHGAYTAAWCWDEHFLPSFAEAGYEATALSLSGHGDSPGREFLDLLSLDDYVRDVLEVMDSFDTPPVLVGHSMGGMVVQKCLEVRQVPAAVLMASVPPQGLWASAVGLAMRKPDLMSELNNLLSGGSTSTDAIREALFAQPSIGENGFYLRRKQVFRQFSIGRIGCKGRTTFGWATGYAKDASQLLLGWTRRALGGL